jgi:hypothetical protein
MKTLCARFEDQDAEELRALSDKQGKTLADVLKEFVLQGMHNAPQPAPQPAPTQPKPPQPAPKPAPTDPGRSGSGSGKLPEVIVNCIGKQVGDRLGLRACATAMRFCIWGPKAVAVSAVAITIISHSVNLVYGCRWLWLAAAIVDGLWLGRERKCEVLDRAVSELWDLITELPERYAQECLTKTPEAATAAVLDYVKERRRRLGQFGVADLRLRSWNPES